MNSEYYLNLVRKTDNSELLLKEYILDNKIKPSALLGENSEAFGINVLPKVIAQKEVAAHLLKKNPRIFFAIFRKHIRVWRTPTKDIRNFASLITQGEYEDPKVCSQAINALTSIMSATGLEQSDYTQIYTFLKSQNTTNAIVNQSLFDAYWRLRHTSLDDNSKEELFDANFIHDSYYNKLATSSELLDKVLKKEVSGPNQGLRCHLIQNKQIRFSFMQSHYTTRRIIQKAPLSIEQLEYLRKNTEFNFAYKRWYNKYSPETIDYLIEQTTPSYLLPCLKVQENITLDNLIHVYLKNYSHMGRSTPTSKALTEFVVEKINSNPQWQEWLKENHINFINLHDNDYKFLYRIAKKYNNSVLQNQKTKTEKTVAVSDCNML